MENDIFGLIAELEGQIENGRRLPFTSQYVIDRESALMLIQTIRDRLPEAIKEAGQIIKQEARILNDAKKYAESVISEADAKGRSMYAESQQRAETLNTNSRQQTDEMLEKAKRQVSDLLEDAKRQSDEMVAQHSIVTRAEKHSSEILAAARGESQRTRMAAVDHCNDLLKRTEDVCIEVANQLRDSRMQLNQER
jgi:vacuolar-type H+-ATPase subunit H